MRNLLQITTSLNGKNSSSSKMANEYVASYLANHPGSTAVKRDLGADPIPHLDAEAFQAFVNPNGDLSNAQQIALERSGALIKELQAMDILVLSVPMYNLGVPSPLKAWIDHVVRARVTFHYNADGSFTGLLTGKKAIVMATRGGFHTNTPLDTQTDYIRNILGFVGITDVQFIYAEGLAIGEDHAKAAMSDASTKILSLAKEIDVQRVA